jgi:hypothetical protein
MIILAPQNHFGLHPFLAFSQILNHKKRLRKSLEYEHQDVLSSEFYVVVCFFICLNGKLNGGWRDESVFKNLLLKQEMGLIFCSFILFKKKVD